MSIAGAGNWKVWRIMLASVVGSAVLLASGCYDPQAVQAFLLKPRRAVSGMEYRVYPPDVISISSINVPEISGATEQIRPDGKINLPLLGEVYVAGKTPKEIEEALAKAARDFYEESDATVRVVGYNSRNFYVFGQVSRPGPMPWTGRDTFLNAMARAQPTTLAWPERIIIVRGPKPMEGGYYQPEPNPIGQFSATGVHLPRKGKEPKKVVVNLMAMVEEGDLSHNIMLMPNDIIYVQPNPYARLGLWIQNILFPVTPVIQTLSVPAYFDQASSNLP